MRKKKRVFGVALMAFLTGLIALVLLGGQSAAGDEDGKWQAFAERFGVLEEATPEQVEGLSAAAQATLAGPSSPTSPIEAMGTTTTSGSHPALVAVVGDVICALDESAEGGGASCGTQEEAKSGQLVVAGLCLPGLEEGDARVFGLMPDGVASVTVHSDGAENLVAYVTDNVYEAVVPAVSTTITASAESGQLDVEMPLDEAAEATDPCDEH